jgi:Phenazine biosynthesis-like protein
MKKLKIYQIDAFSGRLFGDGFRLRWFTPEVEVKLCGHATLASAFVLCLGKW